MPPFRIRHQMGGGSHKGYIGQRNHVDREIDEYFDHKGIGFEPNGTIRPTKCENIILKGNIVTDSVISKDVTCGTVVTNTAHINSTCIHQKLTTQGSVDMRIGDNPDSKLDIYIPMECLSDEPSNLAAGVTSLQYDKPRAFVTKNQLISNFNNTRLNLKIVSNEGNNLIVEDDIDFDKASIFMSDNNNNNYTEVVNKDDLLLEYIKIIYNEKTIIFLNEYTERYNLVNCPLDINDNYESIIKNAKKECELDGQNCHNINAQKNVTHACSSCNTQTDPSDIRIKKNINVLSDSLESLHDISCISYNWDINTAPPQRVFSNPENTHYGVSAQDLQKIYPTMVDTASDGILEVDYKQMIPVLCSSIKELHHIVIKQQKQIDTLLNVSNNSIV